MHSVFPKACIPHVRSLSYLSLGWLALNGLLLTPSASAQPRSTKKPASIVFTAPKPPTPQGAPSGRRQGGASRSPLCQNYEGLTALVPIQNEVVWGLTDSQTPTLWFYLPAAINADLVEAEFVLQDEEDNFVYLTDLSLNTSSAGILPVTIEAPEPALQAKSSYKWTLSLYCDPLKPSASVYVTGSLESVAPSASAQGLSPFEQARQDAKDGIWFDSLTALGELRQEAPDNPAFEQAWMELLQQVDLGNLASEPLL